MSKSIVLNLTGFTTFVPVSIIDEENGITYLIHRHFVTEHAIKKAEELDVSTIKYIGGLEAEDIIEDIKNKGLKVERVEEI